MAEQLNGHYTSMFKAEDETVKEIIDAKQQKFKTICDEVYDNAIVSCLLMIYQRK